MSVAGWQENIAQTLNVHCNGGATFYGRRFGCWVKGGHGPVDLTKAIYQSCDVFFYTLAEKLGIGRIAKYASAFGGPEDRHRSAAGSQRRHAVGRVEDPQLQAEVVCGRDNFRGIGQGAVAITPVQLLRAIAAISMDGKMVVPHVVNPTQLPLATWKSSISKK